MPGTHKARSRDLTPTGGCGSRRLPVAGIDFGPLLHRQSSGVTALRRA